MRLVGQMHEIPVPLPPGPLGRASLAPIRQTFAEVYTAHYASRLTSARNRGCVVPRAGRGPSPRIS